jgi:hypothetical protein
MSAEADGFGEQIAGYWSGHGDPQALVGEFRATRVLCPLTDRGELWSAQWEGVSWLYAFTSEQSLARFARARDAGAQRWEFARIEGGRLLDLGVPALDGPAGVAVDVGSARPMLFPPVAGIVPDRAVAR